MNTALFYKDKPLFGLDIGFSSIKVMQVDASGKSNVVTGYGVANFKPEAVKDGIIVDPETLAKATLELFNKHLIGKITTRRVAVAIPAARTYTRTMTLPKLDAKELTEAVKMEAEQYIPVPLDDLYFDYSMIKKNEKETELLAVAVPKKVVESYTTFLDLLGLDPVVFETTIGAAGRLFTQAEETDVPTVLIDFGSVSTDITVFDKALIVTGTVPGGGDSFTNAISQKLDLTHQEAHVVKTKYGLGVSRKQKEIREALDPTLDQLLKEIRRVIRYYEERTTDKHKISQVVTMGGGANMPGLSEYMTDKLRIPVRMCNPWHNLVFSGLQPPSSIEKSMYITVAGLALINPKGVFHHD
jgi:type IV pilus assembly protein PilM